MPELPEVETVRRGLMPPLLGRRLVRVEARRPDLRRPIPPDLAARLEGQRVTAIDRRAKYILMWVESGDVMLLHLGMSGRMTITPGLPNSYDRHDHVIFITDAGSVLRFNDPRRFGLIDLMAGSAVAGHPLLRDLGPEPLDDGFDGPCLAAALAGKRTPIKAALLDQTVVAGIGNIYASEALNLACIAPDRQATSVTRAEAARLAAAIKDVLTRAIAVGGSSLRDHVQPSGELGYFQHQWRVYDREGAPCPTPGCRGLVKRMVQSNRSTFYCDVCQR